MPTSKTFLFSSLSSLSSSSSSSSFSSSLSPFYRLLLCLFTLLALIVSNHRVTSDRNRFYHISALCLRERVHPLYKKIDGAVISSKSENNLDCTITFQTDTILQKFMLRFEKLALDCNDHLYIYDGAHTHGNHKTHLSCRSTRAETGIIYTQGNFLTLHYSTDAYSKADNGFRLIITAYKDSKNYCREHRCSNQFCISGDLVCDHVNHCGDNSDETYYANCPVYIIFLRKSKKPTALLASSQTSSSPLSCSSFVLCLACVFSVSFCLCRRERLLQRQQQRIALQQQYSGGQLIGPGGQPLMIDPSSMMVGVGAMGIGNHTGATPILQHHNNNSYNSKLDGCTMITSLDGYGATRQNGGLVNSFTHTTLPNNHLAGANFATLPHLHNHNHIASSQQQQQMHQSAAVSVATSGAGGGGGGGQAHVRFGTLPVRGAAGGNNSEKPQPPPAYPGNYFNGGGGGGGAAVGGGIPMMPVNGGPAMAAMHNGGNGILLNGGNGGSNGGIVNIHTPPHSVNSAANQVQTQVIYTANFKILYIAFFSVAENLSKSI
ncbi:hypothetical protein TYRP_005205 [Tyrophagus putrescentiae]|nr:hypothetical protein TYRP_005205 [Tyrophagus putrescentiae]